ncbi:MAG TPA: hypothetical protein VMY59_09995 [Candidatus Thermoplasmatota archaeon]|nr:hypothetical protein [Candidatus Thermoplasmatota archaeon]
MEKHPVGDRIALHVLYDVCLPLQKGDVNTDERKKSNEEIKKTLLEHHCDLNFINDAEYFIADEWEEKKGVIWFKNSKGIAEFVKKNWVIFEKQHPDIFKSWDEVDSQEEFIEYDDTAVQ